MRSICSAAASASSRQAANRLIPGVAGGIVQSSDSEYVSSLNFPFSGDGHTAVVGGNSSFGSVYGTPAKSEQIKQKQDSHGRYLL